MSAYGSPSPRSAKREGPTASRPDGAPAHSLEAIAYAAREKAKADTAANREAEETLVALAAVYGGTLPWRMSFSAEHIRSLVRTAFFAGCNYEMERQEAIDDGVEQRGSTSTTGPDAVPGTTP